MYTVFSYSIFEVGVWEGVMGFLYVRVGPGRYASAQASDRRVVYLFNSGIKTWTIAPMIELGSETGANGTLVSSTDKKPSPSPPM